MFVWAIVVAAMLLIYSAGLSTRRSPEQSIGIGAFRDAIANSNVVSPVEKRGDVIRGSYVMPVKSSRKWAK